MKSSFAKLLTVSMFAAFVLNGSLAQAKIIKSDELQIQYSKEDYAQKQSLMLLKVYNPKTFSYILVPMSSAEYKAWLDFTQHQCIE